MLNVAEFESAYRRQARRAQVVSDLAALHAEVLRWLQSCRDADVDAELGGAYVGRHETQLKAVQTVLLTVVGDLRERAGAIALDGADGSVHESCRRIGDATVWFERLWEYVRSRFEQRFGRDDRAALVRAADEVVWSCYRPVIQRLAIDHPARIRSAAPLAYIEPEYSPAAVQFDRPLPPALRLASGDGALDRMLERMPLATVRLPPWTVSAPWWLVFVGHEVGHHVQHELALVNHVASGVGAAAKAAGLPESACRKWEAWGEEIFADAYSVLMMGPWAVRAVTEVEWGPEAALAQRKVHYPAPVIRIALMTSWAERFGFKGGPMLALEDWKAIAERYASTAEDWPAIARVVDFLCSPLPGRLGRLSDLCGFQTAAYAPRDRVENWAAALRGSGTLVPKRGPIEARLMTSAAFAAWSRIAGEASDEADREKGWNHLLAHAVDAIRGCAEPGKRAGGEIVVDPGVASELALLLLDTPLDARQPSRAEE